MPIYRCNKCGFISDTITAPPGDKVNCAHCANACNVYETTFFVGKLIERYTAALREIESLKSDDKPNLPIPLPTTQNQDPQQATVSMLLDTLDVHNTSQFATPEQHQPLQQWFAARHIKTQFDYSNVDTSGFFDDAACTLGNNFALFGELLDRIRYAYRNSHSGLNLELASLSQKDAQALNNLCRQFYSHTLFARYHYQKPEKMVRLTLQTASTVRQFFEGGWLEWFVFMALLAQLKTKKQPFSCARGVKVIFPNEDLHEIDVMALVDGQTPIYIECKTGEFRRDIDKFLRLKKRLGLTRQQFIICASDLSEEQAAGLTAMYDLTFANLNTLADKLDDVCRLY
ncbi:MAG: hypothetical protein AUK50_11125 [Comamonadaceae bacterium CG2_30_57_122]|nr:MAG: hypothetical protein AUK50_11125 [Comamonadaceae bacterium CG2_30_57_122]